MANEEHVAILRQGVEVWNQWRKGNLTITPDLIGANLGRSNLIGVNLIGANLSGANLSGANLSGANLFRVDLDGADLREANLRKADIPEADFRGADLRGADLQEANLRRIDLSRANLGRAKLGEAGLIEANLGVADLFRADLSGGDLSRANLIRTNLSRANLTEANLTEAKCSNTIFANVNLGKVKGLETVLHKGPSTIGLDTVYQSGGNIPAVFLRGAGLPDNFIIYIKSLTSQAFEFYSCFISYSSQDEAFAQRLYNDLQGKGVRCWFAPKDMRIGDEIRRSIDEAIRVHDKVLLVLSQHSIHSRWVQKEVETAFEQEAQHDKPMLFPIRLDDTVMATNQPWAADIRRMKHIGDFTHWKQHDAYQQAFEQLLCALKAEKTAKADGA